MSKYVELERRAGYNQPQKIKKVKANEKDEDHMHDRTRELERGDT